MDNEVKSRMMDVGLALRHLDSALESLQLAYEYLNNWRKPLPSEPSPEPTGEGSDGSEATPTRTVNFRAKSAFPEGDDGLPF